GMNWSQDAGFGSWRGLYDVVQKANFVILDENLPVTDTVRSYKGEAKIARGLAYFYLLQLYASTPSSGQHQEAGVPLVLEKYDPTAASGRATVAEGYDQVIKDLTEGINEMDPTFRTSKRHLSPTAGRLILAKVYLTRGMPGDFDLAYNLASQVLTSSPSHFAVVPSDEITTYFTGTGSYDENPETIFEIEQNSAYSLGVNAHPGVFYSNQGN